MDRAHQALLAAIGLAEDRDRLGSRRGDQQVVDLGVGVEADHLGERRPDPLHGTAHREQVRPRDLEDVTVADLEERGPLARKKVTLRLC